MVTNMAVPARIVRGVVDTTRRPPSRTSAPALPLRDWKRAFALVDALKSAYRGAPWFHGIRAFREPSTGAIRIEVEVSGADAPSSTLPAKLLALGVRLRRVSAGAAAAAAL
jgi:hypothetical protein